MLSTVQANAYLDKLGIRSLSSQPRGALDALISAHQMAIPFSTVGIHRAQASPDLSIDALYNKVVENGMGGYCFELNKLFEALLSSLGFRAMPALCRAVRGRDARMPINHRGIIVEIDGARLFADVGFGGPMPAGALALANEAEQRIANETYIAVRKSSSWWRVERITQAAADFHDDAVPSRRQIELEVCTAPVEDIDFESLNLACSQPGTLFREHEIVNLRTKRGHKGYKDGVLTLREDGSKHVIELDDKSAQDAALREHFGMNVS